MNRSVLYIVIGIFLVLVSLLADVFGYEDLSSIAEIIIVPIFTLIYFIKAKIKTLLFTVFIVLYSIGDIIRVIDLSRLHNTTYYLCNGMFIISYVLLILYIIKTIKFNELLKRYRLEIFIMIALVVYMIYVLVKFVKPESFETDYRISVQIVELLYNLVLIFILTFSFLNYIQNTNKKYLFLFIGCLIITLSELILVGFYYINDNIWLSYLSTVLYVTGFLILFNQSQMKDLKSRFTTPVK